MSWKKRGIIKQIISGNLLIVRDFSNGKVPNIYPVILMNIICPRLADTENSTDQPFAWEAREFLRSRFLGKNVVVKVHKRINDSFLSTVYLANSDGGILSQQSINEEIASTGFVTVRKISGRDADYPEYPRLVTIENTAQKEGRGRFGTENKAICRSLSWSVDEPASFLEENGGRELRAIVEVVKSACVLRVLLIDAWTLVDVMLAGISCPVFRRDNSDKFAEEAKFFVECRMLQRQVSVVLERVTRSGVMVGTVSHPMGNISLRLLEEGLAWTHPPCSSEFLKAEQIAKNAGLRVWKDHVDIGSESFRAFVFDIIGAEGLVVRKRDGEYLRVYFSGYNITDTEARERTSYSVPFLFEARQVLRELVLGCMVSVTIDGEGGEGRLFASVYLDSTNVACRLLELGLGYYKHNRLSFSSKNELMFAYKVAARAGLGVHRETCLKILDMTDNAAQSKSLLPLLKRLGRTSAVVDRIKSGSRMNLFIKETNYRINFILYGVTTAKIMSFEENEEFGMAAYEFIRTRTMREVHVRVLAVDKYGRFVGWMDVEGDDLSLALVKRGLAWVSYLSFASESIEELRDAEAKAKRNKLKIWGSFEEKAREVSLVEVSLSYIDKGIFYVQRVVDLSRIECIMRELNPPARNTMEPLRPSMIRSNTVCAIRAIQDHAWYRSKILSVEESGIMKMFFIDYGFVEMSSQRARCLPEHMVSIPPMAIPCRLALVEYSEYSAIVSALVREMASKTKDNCFINIEIRDSVNEVLLFTCVDGEMQDFGLEMVRRGLCTVKEGVSHKFDALMGQYWEAQGEAMACRRNVWDCAV